MYYRHAVQTMEPRELALSSYCVAHAYEGLHAFERTPANLISGDVLLRLDNAEPIFRRLGDHRMLGRSYLARARYLGPGSRVHRRALQ